MIVQLEERQTWSAVVGGEGLEVRVAVGAVWLTRERDAEDHLLTAPDTFRSTFRGRLAVEALEPARLEIRSLEPARGHFPEQALTAPSR